MGSISFLTDRRLETSPSIKESIYQLKCKSTLFLDAWEKSPQDLECAGRESEEAMRHLDHIVNEIMRYRDHLQSDNSYVGSSLETHLNITRALSVSPVTRLDQTSISGLGPGNGVLPSPGIPITMEKLLNKIKHRRTDSSNFRVESFGKHIFLIGVDKSNRQPDSIVEFVVKDFCDHCSDIAELI
ncbi:MULTISPECIES: hypothetical protein [Pectobacterium]|uniref:Uncharacterized protein n=1 Tax=Pectobacterium carotovorum subsp. carotovorum (strain PC1) TaxID=561230 RepID=C6DEI4_PECCP|nr:hypothetical protein [Pectobacterium carotovorum]ACT12669.1 conserved hypothetical protein [Pectobacterium carotovorum subsp. carotovorum PC1]